MDGRLNDRHVEKIQQEIVHNIGHSTSDLESNWLHNIVHTM